LRERYFVRFDEGVYARSGYLAGDDDRRATELLRALEDDSIDAIVCARGGYGATRILPRIAVDSVRAANKTIVGFSDVTALHALWARAGVRSLHGPMVAGLGRGTDQGTARWYEALEGAVPAPLEGLERVASGRGRGVLVGGNLAVLTSLIGTPHAPPLDGAVLFLEDVGERPYRVDRMLTQLRHASVFERVVAVALGAFTNGPPGPDGTKVEDVLRERLYELGLPVVAGVPSGHVDDNLELPFGSEIWLDADAGKIVF